MQPQGPPNWGLVMALQDTCLEREQGGDGRHAGCILAVAQRKHVLPVQR